MQQGSQTSFGQQCLEWAERLSYKPDWEFTVYEEIFTGVVKLILVSKMQSSLSDKMINFGSCQDIPNNIKFPTFQKLAHQLVSSVEEHERDEWFKVDGIPPYWPHKELTYQEATNLVEGKQNDNQAA